MENSKSYSFGFLSGHQKVVKHLKKRRANVTNRDSLNRTALHAAIEYAHEDIAMDIVKFLRANHRLEKDSIYFEAEQCKSFKSLHYSNYSGHERVVEFLLENGANVNYTCTNGWSALHVAALQGRHLITLSFHYLMNELYIQTIDESISNYFQLL